MPTVRYPVAITNGIVTNGGQTPATVQGRVGTHRSREGYGSLWPSHHHRRQQRLARAGHERLRSATTATILSRLPERLG